MNIMVTMNIMLHNTANRVTLVVSCLHVTPLGYYCIECTAKGSTLPDYQIHLYYNCQRNMKNSVTKGGKVQ